MSSDATSGTPASGKAALLAEIGAKWDRLSRYDLECLHTSEDIVQHIVDKYGIPRNDAYRDVNTFLSGRTL